MEISIRYVFLKLESMLPVVFAMFYFIGDTSNEASEMMPIKDKISILTGLSISTFYLTKAYKNYFLKDKISELDERLENLENISKSLYTPCQLPHDESSKILQA